MIIHELSFKKARKDPKKSLKVKKEQPACLLEMEKALENNNGLFTNPFFEKKIKQRIEMSEVIEDISLFSNSFDEK